MIIFNISARFTTLILNSKLWLHDVLKKIYASPVASGELLTVGLNILISYLILLHKWIQSNISKTEIQGLQNFKNVFFFLKSKSIFFNENFFPSQIIFFSAIYFPVSSSVRNYCFVLSSIRKVAKSETEWNALTSGFGFVWFLVLFYLRPLQLVFADHSQVLLCKEKAVPAGHRCRGPRRP